MNQRDIVDRVESKLDFLFRRYAYRAIACSVYEVVGSWVLVLESPSCGRALILEDRGEIVFALGPHSSGPTDTSGPWFDVAVVIEYLSEGREMVELEVDDPDRQMARLGDILRPHMDQVASMFGTDEYERARPLLDTIGSRREREIRGDCSEDR